MNSENFHEYVKNPSMLHQVSYQELKSLVLQYPYSPNLRYLLLLKSLFEQSKDFDKNQVLASLSSPDRKKLRQMVKQYSRLREIQENYALNEDFLELKDLSALEKLMDEQTNEATVVGKVASMPTPPSAIFKEEEEADLNFLEEITTGQDIAGVPVSELEEADTLAGQENSGPSEISSVEELSWWDEVETGAQTLETNEPLMPEPEVSENQAEGEESSEATPGSKAHEIPLEITNQLDVQPMPRSSFNSWLKKLNPPQAGILKADLRDISLNNKQLHQPEAEKKEASAKQMADLSVEEDKEIVSETLALLLEKQKFYSKAIAMYERLGLLFPQKSSLFAAKIEELNKKL